MKQRDGKTRILVVDDEESIRRLLKSRFEREGWEVIEAANGEIARGFAGEMNPHAIVSDIKMPGLDGFQLIDAVRSQGIECPIVMITGHGEKECAVEALHKGAFDYLEKPFDMDTIAVVVRRAVEREELRRTNLSLMGDLARANEKLKSQLEVKSELLDRAVGRGAKEELLLGVSDHIRNLKQMAKTVAESFTGDHDPVVLILGESGVGKEMVARYIHSVSSDHDRPFVAVNCAAFPDNLLESELFGYEKGAFTGAMQRKLGLFELASGGTLFLDEIGEMDLKMQAKLLRALQERVVRRLGGTNDIKVSPHIVAATNRDLSKLVSVGQFREDLYYRLNTLPLAVAPLRSRPEDIELLAKSFLERFGERRGKRFKGFSEAAIKAMRLYRWPGNVRELRSVVERAVILEKGPTLELSQLRQEHLHAKMAGATDSVAGAGGFSIGATTLWKDHGESAALVTPVTEQPIDPTSAPEDDLSKEAGVVLRFPTIENRSLSDLRKEIDEKIVRAILVEVLGRERGNVSAVARSLKLDRANLLRLMKRFGIEPDLFRSAKAAG